VVVARVLGGPRLALAAAEVTATTETATTEVAAGDDAAQSDQTLKTVTNFVFSLSKEIPLIIFLKN